MSPRFTYGERQLHPDGFYYRDYTLEIGELLTTGRMDDVVYSLAHARRHQEIKIVEMVTKVMEVRRV